VIRKDAIEGMLLEQVGEGLREFLAEEEGRAALRAILEQIACADDGHDDEVARLRGQKADVERRIYGILDNITETNREFADKRIRELKGELREIEPRLAEMEAPSAAAPDLDELTDAMLGYMEEFDEVVAEGTVEERRAFIRAFVTKVELDPAEGRGRAQLLSIPRLTALPLGGDNAAKSSFNMVAGARFVLNTQIPELERPHVIDYRQLGARRA